MTDTFVGLINNAALLLSLGVLYDAINLEPTLKSRWVKVLMGGVIGVIGIAIMLTPWHFGSGIVFDTRSILLSITGLFFGFIPAVISTLITIIYRLYQGGDGAWTGVGVQVTSAGLGLLCRYHRHRFQRVPDWLTLYGFGVIVHIAMLLWMLTLPGDISGDVLNTITLPVMLIYPVGTVLLGLLLRRQYVRRRTESALQDSESRMKTILDNLPVGVWIADGEGNIKQGNPAGQRIWAGAKYVGIDQFDVYRAWWLDTGEELKSEDWAISRVVTSGESCLNQELEIECFDKTHKYIINSAVPIKDHKGQLTGVVVVNQDVSRLKQAENDLRKSRESLQTIIHSSPVAIIVVDEQGFVRLWNPAAERIFGWREDEVLGQFQPIISDDKKEEFKRNRQTLKESGSFSDVQVQRLRRDGTFVDLSMSTALLENMWDDSPGFMAIFIDVTERKQAEERLIESEKRYRALFENMNAGFVLFEIVQDEQGVPVDLVILAANEGFDATTGLKIQEIIGEHLTHALPGIENDAADWIGTYGKIALTGESRQFVQGSELLGYYYSVSAFRAAPNQCAVTFVDITERKRAEEELRQSEELFSNAFHVGPAGMTITRIADGKFIDANESFCEMFALSRDEVVGHTSIEVNIWTPEERGRFVQAHREQDGLHNFELVIGANSERRITLLLSSTKLNIGGEDCYLTTMIDITERKKAEEELRESEANLKRSQEVSHVGHWVWDTPTNTVTWSDEMKRIFGLDPEEFTGDLTKVIERSIHPDDREKVNRSNETVLTEGRPTSMEYRVVWEDGTVRWVWAEPSDKVLDDSSNVIRLSGIVQDITERKQAEQEIRQLNEELEQRVIQRTAQLEAANRELEAFSYSVSHDLRAPLRAMNGFSTVLMEKYGTELPEQAQHYLQRIHRNANRMGDLIDDLLAFSRLSRQPLEKQNVDVQEIVQQALEELSDQSRIRGAEIIVGSLPPCHADPHLLRQVFVNLIDNALKYSQKRMEIKVEIGYTKEEGNHIYSVKDNGVGFDMRYVDKLFGVFQRLHDASEYEGTGVGLATVQRIIHRHGGRIWVQAKVDQGATFFFTLESGESIDVD